MSATASLSFDSVRATMVTWLPRLANSLATDSPMLPIARLPRKQGSALFGGLVAELRARAESPGCDHAGAAHQ